MDGKKTILCLGGPMDGERVEDAAGMVTIEGYPDHAYHRTRFTNGEHRLLWDVRYPLDRREVLRFSTMTDAWTQFMTGEGEDSSGGGGETFLCPRCKVRFIWSSALQFRHDCPIAGEER